MQAEPTSAPPPSDVDYIAYHAALRPDKVAIIVNGDAITYITFYEDIGRFATALRRLDLSPGQTVGVCHPHPYLHWLVVLALEVLGVTSFSYLADEISILEDELREADLLLCSPEGAPEGFGRTHLMDQQWFDRIRQYVPEQPMHMAPIAPDTPLRITRSSGTTGRPNRMYHTAGIRESWIRNYLLRAGVNNRSRYLMSIGFNIQGMQYYAAACTRMGGTCIFDSRTDLAAVLASQNISHVALPTFALQQLLHGLPANYQKPHDLTIFLISAAVPSELRARIRQHLADEIIESYGTNETGGICDMAEDGTGRALPYVAVEVVNDVDQPMVGKVGRIRVRSDGVVGGYIGDPEATAQMFRDGWFYPGDLGIMRDAQTLQLIGRADDMFNIGGKKFSPAPVEERLRQSLPVADICLVESPGDAGVNRLCVVAVPDEHTDADTLKSALSLHLPTGLGAIELIFADRIPRTSSGKVKRAELVDNLRKHKAARS